MAQHHCEIMIRCRATIWGYIQLGYGQQSRKKYPRRHRTIGETEVPSTIGLCSKCVPFVPGNNSSGQLGQQYRPFTTMTWTWTRTWTWIKHTWGKLFPKILEALIRHDFRTLLVQQVGWPNTYRILMDCFHQVQIIEVNVGVPVHVVAVRGH